MRIEDMIKAWKADDEDAADTLASTSPIGRELSDKELLEIVGGIKCLTAQSDCWASCDTGDTGG